MYTRNCQSCGNNIEYLNINTYKIAVKNNSICRSCSAKIRSKKYPSVAFNKIVEEIKSGERQNAFLGKKHSDSTIQKLKKVDRSYTKEEDFRKKISDSTSGKKNPMYGKNLYDTWVDKYGIEIADIKLSEMKKKISDRTAGKNNPMYGKIPPIGAGNGWSGWYNGWYFRSILELSYMINVIERFNLKWETGENSKYEIKYTDSKSVERTYRPDFMICNKYLIEIKPKKLRDLDDVKLKEIAAKEFCILNSFTYKITSCSVIGDGEIYKLVESGKIKFVENCIIKYNERYKN